MEDKILDTIAIVCAISSGVMIVIAVLLFVLLRVPRAFRALFGSSKKNTQSMARGTQRIDGYVPLHKGSRSDQLKRRNAGSAAAVNSASKEASATTANVAEYQPSPAPQMQPHSEQKPVQRPQIQIPRNNQQAPKQDFVNETESGTGVLRSTMMQPGSDFANNDESQNQNAGFNNIFSIFEEITFVHSDRVID